MILAIETSTPQGSVAVVGDEGALLFDESFQAGRSHSSQLFAMLERALAVCERPGRIVVGLGPGSYAGVRIAISAAVGLSVAAGGELLGMPSIVTLGGEEYLALGDARRESFYFARVRGGICLDGPRLMEAGELEAALQAPDGSAFPRYASEALPTVAGVETRYPSASALALFASRGIGITARGVLEPIYLREPYITQPKPRPNPR